MFHLLRDDSGAPGSARYGLFVRRCFAGAYARAYAQLGSRAEAAAIVAEAFALAERCPATEGQALEEHFEVVLNGLLRQPSPTLSTDEPDSNGEDCAVRAALMSLDAVTRLAVVMRHYAGWSPRAIAKACGTTVSDIKTRLSEGEVALGREVLAGIPRAVAPAVRAEDIALGSGLTLGRGKRIPAVASLLAALVLAGGWAVLAWHAPRPEPLPAPAPVAEQPRPVAGPAPAPVAAVPVELPSRTLAGRVVDAVTGAAVKEFEVAHPADTDASGRPVFVATSDPEGRFHLAGLKAGSHEIRVRASGYADATVAIDREHELVVKLERVRSVEGTVVDGGGNPIEGAFLFAGDIPFPAPEGKEHARSDRAGRFRLDLPPAGDAVVRAYHPEYAEASAAPASPLRLVMGPAGRIEATVRAAGEPLAGAVVSVESPGATTVEGVVDDGGKCLLAGIPAGAVTVTARSAGARFAARQVEVEAGRTAGLAFTLPPRSSRLEGVVLVKGKPVRHARVEARVVTESGDEYRCEAQVSLNGRYITEPLPPGEVTLHAMAATSDSRLRRQKASLSLPPDIVLRHDVGFSGKSFIQGGLQGLDPDQHARVFALLESPGRQPRSLEQLNELTYAAVGRRFMRGNGSFRFESLEPGEYILYAIALRDESPQDFAQAPIATARVTLGARPGDTARLVF